MKSFLSLALASVFLAIQSGPVKTPNEQIYEIFVAKCGSQLENYAADTKQLIEYMLQLEYESAIGVLQMLQNEVQCQDHWKKLIDGFGKIAEYYKTHKKPF